MTLMKIPISAKIPRSYGYWQISSALVPTLRLIFMRGVVPIGT
jgi:hypothetical protein